MRFFAALVLVGRLAGLGFLSMDQVCTWMDMTVFRDQSLT